MQNYSLANTSIKTPKPAYASHFNESLKAHSPWGPLHEATTIHVEEVRLSAEAADFQIVSALS